MIITLKRAIIGLFVVMALTMIISGVSLKWPRNNNIYKLKDVWQGSKCLIHTSYPSSHSSTEPSYPWHLVCQFQRKTPIPQQILYKILHDIYEHIFRQ